MNYDTREFQRVWNECYSHIGYLPTRVEIEAYIAQCESLGIFNISRMVDLFSDYILSQGLADDVQE